MDWFTNIWGWVVGIASGVSYGAILTAVIVMGIKRIGNKSEKKQVEICRETTLEATEYAIEKGLGAIKTKVHKHDIEPLVEEKLRIAAKVASEEQVKELQRIHEENQKIVAILEKFSVYFDDSYYISAETKAELKEAISNAKENKADLVESELEENYIDESPSTENNPQNESHKTNSIER